MPNRPADDASFVTFLIHEATAPPDVGQLALAFFTQIYNATAEALRTADRDRTLEAELELVQATTEDQLQAAGVSAERAHWFTEQALGIARQGLLSPLSAQQIQQMNGSLLEDLRANPV